jgi:hypothetical protein
MDSPADEPTLAHVQGEYASWHCWRGISGLYYARPADSQPGDPATVKGEDALDLRDQIRRAEAAAEHAATNPPASPHPGRSGSGQEC